MFELLHVVVFAPSSQSLVAWYGGCFMFQTDHSFPTRLPVQCADVPFEFIIFVEDTSDPFALPRAHRASSHEPPLV
jgi:hypothetical protein